MRGKGYFPLVSMRPLDPHFRHNLRADKGNEITTSPTICFLVGTSKETRRDQCTLALAMVRAKGASMTPIFSGAGRRF